MLLFWMGYIICSLAILGCGYLVHNTWQDARQQTPSDQVSYFANAAQVIFIAFGSIIALYSLQHSIFDLARQQNISTNRLLEKYPTDELFDKTDEIRRTLNLAFRPEFNKSMDDEERRQILIEVLDTNFDSQVSWVKEATSILLTCARSQECASDAVKNTLCFNFDDFVRLEDREMFLDLPKIKTKQLIDARHLMARYQERSCTKLHTLLDRQF